MCQNPGNSRILTSEIIFRKVFGVGGRLTRKGIYPYIKLIYIVVQGKSLSYVFLEETLEIPRDFVDFLSLESFARFFYTFFSCRLGVRATMDARVLI